MDFALGLPQNIYDSHTQISPQTLDVIGPAQADYLHSLDTVLSCQDGMFNLDGSFDFSTAVDYHFHGPLMDPSNQSLVIPPRIFSTLGENGYSFDDAIVGFHG
ncbi:hypothetical protein FDECE_15739 [Fusarium decemcellulare]|nr:hypothetical protein FDECE_15739 [Fusarium decemcellulare]